MAEKTHRPYPRIGEVERETYFFGLELDNRRGAVLDAIRILSDVSEEIDRPVTVLGVGSAVFPARHRKRPELGDIDLRVMFGTGHKLDARSRGEVAATGQMHTKQLAKAEGWKIGAAKEYTDSEIIIAGISYDLDTGKRERVYSSYIDYNNNDPSIVMNRDGLGLSLHLSISGEGRVDPVEHVRLERHNRYGFSLLFSNDPDVLSLRRNTMQRLRGRVSRWRFGV